MKQVLLTIISILLSIIVSSTAFSQVKTDYDKSVNFSDYTTYSFSGWQKNSDQAINDFDKKRIADALKTEFETRGINLVTSNANAAISIYIVIDNKTSTTAYTDYNGGFGYGMDQGWGWGYNPGMMMTSSTTTFVEDDYKVGTIVVDMYDTTTKKLLWQGVLTEVIKDNAKKHEAQIVKGISKMMRGYPIKTI